jgi:hypothetical protein
MCTFLLYNFDSDKYVRSYALKGSETHESLDVKGPLFTANLNKNWNVLIYFGKTLRYQMLSKYFSVWRGGSYGQTGDCNDPATFRLVA